MAAGNSKAHLYDHLANGYVFSTPSLFMMAKAIAFEDGRVAWYVTYGRGSLRTLRSLIPFALRFIAFRRHRHGREVLRAYRFDRVLQLASTLQPAISP